ncbi:MAG: phosphatase PAP2 family protein [candidate division Zixibacteria bacterium]|nr:phosphatase PAP2 family protein [candidate division Zixibacteria bacterium]
MKILSLLLMTMMFFSMTEAGLSAQSCHKYELEKACFMAYVRAPLVSQIHFNADSDSSGTQADEERSKHIFKDLGYAVVTSVKDAAYIYSSPARIDKKSALWLAGIASAGAVIYIYDREIYDFIREHREDDPLKPFVNIGEELGTIGMGGTTAKYFLGSVALGYLLDIDPLMYIGIDLVESYYIAGLLKNAVNLFAGRRRPHEGMGARYFEFNGGTSMPSGHTANVFQMANIFSRHIKFWPFTIVAYTIAGSIGIERVASEAHWPSDVYVAAIYGWVISDVLMDRNQGRRFDLEPYLDPSTATLGFQLKYSF